MPWASRPPRFDQLEQKVDNGFAQIDRNFADVRGRLDATAAGQQQIVDLLTRLIEQQDGPQSEQ
jgi:hypothetical protein